jgi:hypothetical protein
MAAGASIPFDLMFVLIEVTQALLGVSVLCEMKLFCHSAIETGFEMKRKVLFFCTKLWLREACKMPKRGGCTVFFLPCVFV